MRTEKEIQELQSELSQIIDFINDSGTDEESEDEDVNFANDVLDVIDWVLGEIATEDFKIEPYLNMDRLEEIVSNIKERIGEDDEETED